MTGIVLGSGLGVLADEVEVLEEVGFAEAGLAVSTVPGHAGRFVFGKLGGTDVVLMKGRVHLYEGHGADAVTAGVRWMAGKGVESIILTNAAGTVNRDFPPGTWMALSDHLNLTGTTPLVVFPMHEVSGVFELLLGRSGLFLSLLDLGGRVSDLFQPSRPGLEDSRRQIGGKQEADHQQPHRNFAECIHRFPRTQAASRSPAVPGAEYLTSRIGRNTETPEADRNSSECAGCGDFADGSD